MKEADYKFMTEGVTYNAYYQLGGKCLIKKATEDDALGVVTACFENGTVVRRHYVFFTLLNPSGTDIKGNPIK